MKSTLFLVLFMISLNSFSEEEQLPSFDISKMRLIDDKQDELANFKKDHPDWEKLPNDEYATFYNDWAFKYQQRKVDLHESHCQQTKKHCLPGDVVGADWAEMHDSIHKVVYKNKLAKKTNLDEKAREKLYKNSVREGAISLCAAHKRKCDTLTKSEVVAVTMERKRTQKLRELEKGLLGVDLDNPKYKELWLSYEDEKLKGQLKDMKILCTLKSGDPLFCGPESLDELKARSNGMKCFTERLVQSKALSKPRTFRTFEMDLVTKHEDEWENSEYNCETILENDKKLLAQANENENEDEETPQNFKPESCEWSKDLPRQILVAPSCKQNTHAKVCSGYVVCDRKEGGGKFVRLSTCDVKYCGSSKVEARKCSEDKEFSARKAPDLYNEFISNRVKKEITTPPKKAKQQ